MNKPIDRPPSIWITQILLALPFLNLAIALPVTVFQCFSSESVQSCLSTPKIISFAVACLMLVLLLLAFWGLQKRKRYGKWLAVALLVGGMVVAITEGHSLQLIYRLITQGQALPAPPYECWKSDGLSYGSWSCGYSSYPELGLRIISDIVPALFLGFLLARLLSSPAAKRFFL
jgi:heme/copper-type cytochrome/quinol oxidase subunit 4